MHSPRTTSFREGRGRRRRTRGDHTPPLSHTAVLSDGTYDTLVLPLPGVSVSLLIRILIQANKNYGEAWTVSSSWC